MAPIKFEEHIKEKIEERHIQPSSGAWQKLSNRLDKEPKQKPKGYWWLGIAASFIGLVIISVVMLNNTSENSTPILVNEDVQTDTENIDNKQPVVNDNDIKNNQIVVEESQAKSIIKSKDSQIEVTQTATKTEDKKALIKEELPEEKTNTLADVTPKEAPIKNELSLEDIKVQEVVAQIEQLKKEQEHVSNEEIDALLKQAQKEIIAQRLYNSDTKTVSAEALLLSVEDDLENSFRDRVFEALKSGYETVKVAVTERNQ